jgi:hypothetical protein
MTQATCRSYRRPSSAKWSLTAKAILLGVIFRALSFVFGVADAKNPAWGAIGNPSLSAPFQALRHFDYAAGFTTSIKVGWLLSAFELLTRLRPGVVSSERPHIFAI